MAQQPAAYDPDADPRTFDEILRDEFVCLKNRRAAVFGGPPAGHDADSELRNTLFGICFSGGGIRSATFNLGIIQGLAGQGMLKLADYLSTVSGGGYTGSWFHGVVRREPFKELKGVDRKPYESYEDYLACEDTKPGIAGQDPVSFLRKYSNYLSPQLGLLSPDSWVIGTIWLRNTILNQLILFLAIAAALMAALCLGNALKLLDAGAYGTFLGILLAVVLFGVVYRINQNTGRIVKYEFGQPRKGEAKDTDTSTWLTVILPLWVVSILFSFLLTTGGLGLLNDQGGYFVLLALLLLFGFSLGYSGFWTCYQRRHETKARWKFNRLALFVVFVMTCSVVTFALLALEQKFLFNLLRTGAGSWQYASPPPPTELGRWLCILLAPVLTILVLAFGVALQQGLAGVDFSDSAREWYSRLAAKLFIVCACWLAWFGVAAFAPVVVYWTYKHYIAGLTTASLAWIVSTVAGVLSGKSAATAGPTISDGAQQSKKTSKTLELIAEIAPPIALVGILVAMATACWSLLDLWLQAKPEFTQHPESVDHRLWSLTLGGNLWLLQFVFLIGLVAYLLSTRININEFSLNHFYKNRLVRCYLGASQGKDRQPNRFTGFDPKDDILLTSLVPGTDYDGPFAIVNCTLNLNHGKELAWQERKASSFVFTPAHCGYVPTRDPINPAGYVQTVNFVEPGGPRIGMAMGISGAAVNPNWGSHTQASTAFLLTLFNVRLGWWVGNTRFTDAAATPGPRVALLYLISELLGLTDEDSRYVNLSDGGHFENLGLYELARRKCRFIIVGDGEQDDTYQFESLGGAIRKIRVDFGYSVDISPKRIFLDPEHVSQAHCALGTIDYHDGSKCGTILYLKASLTGDESYDVLQHKKASPSFPHDTTLNQFFTESMFESYRTLGKHLVQKVFYRVLDDVVASQRRPEHLEEIFKQLGQRWLPPLTSAPGSFVRHTKAYSSLIRRLAEDKDLKFLDLEVYDHFPGEQPPPRKEFTQEQLRKGRLLVIDFIQLMENVYLDLNLEDDSQWLHQENAGWVRLFRHWTKQPTFKEVWESAHDTYGLAFREFYERIKNPQSAPPDCKHLLR